MRYPMKSQDVVNHILHQVLDLLREMEPGAKLPSERLLADRFQVSRTCVREAIRTLVGMGMVEIRPGRGTYSVVDPGKLVSPGTWFPWTTENIHEIVEILEVRDALTAKAASLAAIRATLSDITVLEVNVRRAECLVAQDDFDARQFSDLDLEFHNVLAEACHNPLLTKLTHDAYRLASEGRGEMFTLGFRAAASIQQHRDILEAIKSRDPGEAARLMSVHISSVIRSAESLSVERGVLRSTQSGENR